MGQLQDQIKDLKKFMIHYFLLVNGQLSDSKKALLKNDKELAKKIIKTELEINSIELQVDEKCENILTLFNPVAKDLRRVLAIYRISHELERIADISDSIADYIVEDSGPFSESLMKEAQTVKMFTVLENMQEDIFTAFENDSAHDAMDILAEDVILNDINNRAVDTIAEYLNKKKHPNIKAGFRLLGLIKKLERAGDHIKNIAEEIVFSVNADVIKHQNKHKLSS